MGIAMAAATVAAAAASFAAPFPPSLYATIYGAVNATIAQLGPGPSGLYAYPTNGVAPGAYGWQTGSAGGWTSGFFPGMLYKLYDRSGLTDAFAFAQANERSAGIASQQFNRGTHDVGFMVYTAFGQQYALTGNATARRYTAPASAAASARR